MEGYYFKLENKKIIECKNVEEYLKWQKLKYEFKNTPIKHVIIEKRFNPTKNNLGTHIGYQQFEDGSTVSTVFLGINHSYGGENSEPVLFETMIFGGEFNEEQERYCTYEDAIIGHKKYVEIIKKEIRDKEKL